MRIFLGIGLLVAGILGVLILAGQCSAEPYNQRSKITDTERRVIGSIYCPTGQRRCQILDHRNRVRGYIEPDGDITDTRRRRVYSLEDVLDK